MKAVLDTHAFIWMDSAPHRVSPAVLGYLSDPNWTVYLSVVSIWEMAIKIATGKLVISDTLDQLVRDHQAQTPLTILGVEFRHALAVTGLPSIHKDPFDRMLVAQAVAEDAVLLTADPVLSRYPVRTDW